MTLVNRRWVLKGAALSALAYTVAGAEVLLSPREAQAQGLPLKVLTADERAALEALGETLLPGARDAGLAHYVDQQLSVDPGECLLLARALGVKFAELAADKRAEFVEQIRQKVPEDWSGPPSPFFYFVSRGDAVDVTYGTVEGFERLGIPYMPHIIPIKRW